MEDRHLYDVNNGVRGRDGGPYYDEEERTRAELVRARLEGRRPETNVDRLPATAGTVLALAAQVPDNVNANPSMANAPGPGAALLSAKDDPNFLSSPVAVVSGSDLEEPTPVADSTDETVGDSENNSGVEDDEQEDGENESGTNPTPLSAFGTAK
jgi:hypothetical protein